MLIGALAAVLPVPAAAQLDEAPFNALPADARVVISESTLYPGAFVLSTTARVCGEVPAELNFGGVPAFIVHFYPDDGQGEIRDISFDSKELVGGVTTSSVFFLSVGVQSPAIGSPQAYVLDTSRPKMSGTAALEFPAPRELVLTIKGENDMGEDIDLVLHCGPKEGAH
jgi:hypothetical protein